MIDEYKKVIVDYCKTHPGTSFAELNDAFNDADLDYRGAESIVLADYENVVIWSNWCSDAVQAFQELLNDEITIDSCDVLIYAIDRIMLDFCLPSRSTRGFESRHMLYMPLRTNGRVVALSRRR